jgi:hypothetical protein
MQAAVILTIACHTQDKDFGCVIGRGWSENADAVMAGALNISMRYLFSPCNIFLDAFRSVPLY